MNGQMELWENRLRDTAQDLPYPPTPDIARRVRQMIAGHQAAPARRRMALATATFILLFLAGLLSVPSVRAAVIEFIQIGVIRIFVPESTQTPIPTLSITTTPELTPIPNRTLPPSPTPRDLIALEDLQGETTLEEAIQKASFTLELPTQPPDLGEPDRVFVQDMRGAMVILVWTETGNPDKAELVLYEIAPGSFAGEKGMPYSIERAQVNGREAVWAQGPYVLYLSNGDMDLRRLIAGHVLIWDENGVTYRLESNLDLSQAIEIAESLEPIP
jgi:hypothetical protein